MQGSVVVNKFSGLRLTPGRAGWIGCVSYARHTWQRLCGFTAACLGYAFSRGAWSGNELSMSSVLMLAVVALRLGLEQWRATRAPAGASWRDVMRPSRRIAPFAVVIVIAATGLAHEWASSQSEQAPSAAQRHEISVVPH